MMTPNNRDMFYVFHQWRIEEFIQARRKVRLMRTIILTVVFALALAAYVLADTIDIKPAYIQQMDYKVSQLMPCNWDPASTMVHGYYGEMPEMPAIPESESQLERMDVWKNAKSEFTKLSLDGKIITGVFGSNLNLGFTPELMQNDGLPLQIVEIEYTKNSKKCKAGFSGGLLTR